MPIETKNYDFIIMGAGIVGLTVAKRLTVLYPNASIALIEKEARLGVHASGRNSGVMHSGIYYGSDTLKASMCTQGAARMIEFAKEHGIAYKQEGKVIVATSESEEKALQKLLENAKNNHIEATHLDEAGIRKIEPYAKAPFGGIYCPTTAVIDSPAVLSSLEKILKAKGVAFHFDSLILSIDPEKQKLSLGKNANTEVYGYKHLFNCAGTSAVRLANYFDIANEYELLPFKGLYYKVKPEKDYLVKSNIYPVPDPALPFLGVHLTRVISGDVYVGPTVIPALGQENYSLFGNIDLKEMLTILKFLSTMVIHNKHNFRKLVFSEMKKYLKPYFVKAANKLIQGLEAKDMVLANKVGIRPQLVNKQKKMLETDFIVKQGPASTHVLNAISPAFTSSLAFADLIVETAKI